MKTAWIALALLAPAAAPALGVQDYLKEVRQANPQLQSLRAQDTALALAAKEPLTAYSPQLNAGAQRAENQAEPALAAFSAESTKVTGWNVGLSKLFSSGTYVGLDYKGDYTDLMFPAGSFIVAAPSYGHEFGLTLSQSLWRNVGGRQVQAAVDQAAAGAEAARAGNRFQALSVVFEARRVYQQLQSTRQLIALQTESLERNKKILEWTKRKQADNLADRVDVLQVEAAQGQTALGLAASQQEEARLKARFNTLRGAAPEAEVPELEASSAPSALPEAAGERLDIAAAKAALRGGDAQVEGIRQRYTPDLSVFGQLGMNERDPEMGKAFTDSFNAKHPVTMVGVKLTANLDLGLLNEVLTGAETAKSAGAAQVKDKVQAASQDWQNLRDQWASLQKQLELARTLEQVQQEKAEREKRRYQDGRTTNFQVLRFEEDYNQARILSVQLNSAAAILAATANFYNGGDQPW
jgi:outer membrane protein TolC